MSDVAVLYFDLEDFELQGDSTVDDESDNFCVMTGELKHEKKLVSVTGCPGEDSFEVRH